LGTRNYLGGIPRGGYTAKWVIVHKPGKPGNFLNDFPNQGPRGGAAWGLAPSTRHLGLVLVNKKVRTEARHKEKVRSRNVEAQIQRKGASRAKRGAWKVQRGGGRGAVIRLQVKQISSIDETNSLQNESRSPQAAKGRTKTNRP